CRITGFERGEEHVDDTLTAQTDADLVVVILRGIVGDQGRTTQSNPFLRAAQRIAFKAASADTAEIGSVVEDQHSRTRPAIGRTFDPDDGGKRRLRGVKVDGLPGMYDGPDLLHATKGTFFPISRFPSLHPALFAVSRFPSSHPALFPVSQKAPEHDHLADMIARMIDKEDGLAQQVLTVSIGKRSIDLVPGCMQQPDECLAIREGLFDRS